MVFVVANPRLSTPSFMSQLCDGHLERLSPHLQSFLY
jgi:hypothetical protein